TPACRDPREASGRPEHLPAERTVVRFLWRSAGGVRGTHRHARLGSARPPAGLCARRWHHPLGPAMQHSAAKPVDPLSVHVYGFALADSAAAAKASEAWLYEDDGLSNNYLRGAFQRTGMRYRQTREAAALEVSTASGDGNYHAPARNYRLQFHGLKKPASVILDGKELPFAKGKAARESASWSADETTGDISVVVPRSKQRAFTIELLAPPVQSFDVKSCR